MRRIIIRSVVLTLTIILALVIANVAPETLDKFTGADGNIRGLIVIGILLLIIVLIIAGNIIAQKIKSSRNGKNQKQ